MRLTKYDKEAFVRAVMQDIPQIDYKQMLRIKILNANTEKLPPAAKALLCSTKDEHLIKREKHEYAAHDERGLTYVWCDTYPTDGWQTEAFNKEITEIVQKAREQDAAREAVETKLTGIIESCSTLKKAHETLPEFIKYLPQQRSSTGVGNLPAIANIVADLSKMGWPKDQQGAAA